MKTKTLASLFMFMMFVTKLSLAQGSGAMSFMLLQQSPELAGAGNIGTAIATNDPIGFYYNPAILGYTSRNNHIAFSTMPSKTKWGSIVDVKFWNTGGNIGYNFENSSVSIPLSIGLGIVRNTIEYDWNYIMNTVPPDKDSFTDLSLGIGYHNYLYFNLGFSARFFDSILQNGYPGGRSSEAKGTAFDIGALIIVPVSELWLQNTKYNFSDNSFITPLIDFSLGYSLTNLGEKVHYLDPAQADPLSRTARLGYSIGLGTDWNFQETKINLFKYSFTAEAEDGLIEDSRTDYYSSEPKYQGMFGDIDVVDNLIGLNPSNQVIVHKGHILNLFETFTLISGRYTGGGYSEIRKSNGYGISSEGVSKLISALTESEAVDYIARHIAIDFYSTKLGTGSLVETKLQTVNLRFSNIEL